MNEELLNRFFKKACSEEEVKEVLAWFEKEHIDNPDAWQNEWNLAEKHSDQIPPAHDPNALLHKLHQSISPVNAPRRMPYAIKMLLVALPVFLAAGILLYFNHTPASSEIKNRQMASSTLAGQKKKVLLHDRSNVFLNSESHLSYPKVFETSRTVVLEGEAYFEVHKNPKKPFIVKTGKLITTALGTAFNIEAYQENNTITISLTEGTVQIDNRDDPENSIILKAGEQIILYKDSGRMVKQQFNLTDVLAWKNNTIIFRQANLEEVIQKLERWYGVSIDVTNTSSDMTDWNYSGSFTDESLQNVLEGMSYVKGFTYNIKDNYVELNLNTSK